MAPVTSSSARISIQKRGTGGTAWLARQLPSLGKGWWSLAHKVRNTHSRGRWLKPDGCNLQREGRRRRRSSMRGTLAVRRRRQGHPSYESLKGRQWGRHLRRGKTLAQSARKCEPRRKSELVQSPAPPAPLLETPVIMEAGRRRGLGAGTLSSCRRQGPGACVRGFNGYRSPFTQGRGGAGVRRAGGGPLAPSILRAGPHMVAGTSEAQGLPEYSLLGVVVQVWWVKPAQVEEEKGEEEEE